MQFVNNEIFEAAMNDEYLKKTLMKVARKNLKSYFTEEEITSVIMSTLFKCLKNYKEEKNVKFVTFLHRSIDNNTKRMLGKKVKEYKFLQKQKSEFNLNDLNRQSVSDYRNKQEIEMIRDILESVKEINPKYHDILFKKYYEGMTNREIASHYGLTGEGIRKILKKALNLCRELCISK